jgi:hypothetical protein
MITIAAWLFKWGIRFRLVGVTSFTGVLTASLFALNLGLHNHTVIPGAVPFTRVYDTGASQVVIAVPNGITAEQLDATLRQAAFDLASPGRLSSDGKLTVRARTVLHQEPGISQPLYVGQVSRALNRQDQEMTVQIDRAKLAQASQFNA